MSKVSVIVPIYNVSQYLHEAMDSLVRQTLKDIEIICVNDGSTDNSLDIINEYAAKDDRIVVITGPNGGYGKAMNKGLDRATGEYIGILEPDDYLHLTMMEDLYLVASRNNLDFVKADFYRFGRAENGDMTMSYVALDNTGKRYNQLLHPNRDPSLIRFVMNTWAGIYRREFLNKYHIRHNETPGASYQDNGFFFQTTVYAERAMIINKPYYRNRRDNPNSSVNSKEKVYCANVEYDYIREILMIDRQLWDRFKAMYNWKKYQNCQFTLNRIGEQFKYEYVQRMGKEFKRAYSQGEFNKDVFTPLEWSKLTLAMEKPDIYYASYVVGGGDLREKLTIATQRVRDLENSNSYRVGRILTWPIRFIKRLLGRSE
ncbi:MAG: glycosyltransferase [Oscillospiraceae bacterium]|nr:glycosyltransferase [Oscillospiraceae bacterium]